AGHDHAAAAGEQQLHGPLEVSVDPVDQPEDRVGFRLEHLAREIQRRGGVAHAGAPIAMAWIRTSRRRSGCSRSRRRAFCASLFARPGSWWTSMNTPSTPAATPADAIGPMYSAWPAVTPSPAPGS